MKKYVVLLLLLTGCCLTGMAQSGFPNYYRFIALSQEGDSLYTAGRFAEAAKRYEAAAGVTLEKAIAYDVSIMHYNAACAYAKAGNLRAAMNSLDLLVNKHGYADAAQLEAEGDFAVLRKEKGWPELLAAAERNKKRQEAVENTRKARTTLVHAGDAPVFYPLTSFAESLIKQDSLVFLSLNHGIFRVYFAADGHAATRLPALKAELDDAYQRGLEVLQEKQFGRGLNVVLLNSLDEMEQVSGMRVRGGVALVGHDLMLLPYHTGRRPQLRHELFHLMSNESWGITQSRLLNEGTAVYADNRCYGENPLYGISKQLLEAGRLLPLDALISDFDNQARISDVIAYLQSAALCRYLYETYGLERYKALWTSGFAAFEKIYGKTTAEFEQEWMTYIRGVKPSAPVDLELLLKEGCG